MEIGTKKTRIETLLRLRRKPRLVPDHRVMDGINAVRETLPRCWFDADKTESGLECLRQYRSEYDEKKLEFSDNPRHDWTSHAADAFRYLAMAWRELAQPKPEKINPDNIVLQADQFGGVSYSHNLSVKERIDQLKRKRARD